MLGLVFYLFGLFFVIFFVDSYFLVIIFQFIIFLFCFLLFFYLMGVFGYNFWVNIFYDFGFDKVSLVMVFFVSWVFCLVLMTIYCLNFYTDLLLFYLNFLLFVLFMFFCSMNFVYFYIFFEFSLLPILLIVFGWGVQPERLQAGLYMFMYTIFASMPFFILVIYFDFEFNTFSFLNFYLFDLNFDNFFVGFFMLLLFFVKLPIYLFHLWLPKVHVEAPIFGSMILSGLMLKLGGYGMLRVLIYFYSIFVSLFFIVYIFMGFIVISFLCLRQVDLKMMVAYFSVVHMGVMSCCLLSMNYLFLKGSVIMMVSHGFTSSGLFSLLGIIYSRFGSRSLIINKGFGCFFSYIMMWWFIFCVINMSAPPSLSLVSEIFVMIVFLNSSLFYFFFLFILIFFNSFFCIYLYSFCCHGNCYFFSFLFSDIYVSEYLLIVFHWFPLNFYFLNLNFC